MPCVSGYLNHNARERESQRVLELIREARGMAFNHQNPFSEYYGKVDELDADTAWLCDFCTRTDLTKYSLELQMWWRDHQAADERRKSSEQAKIEAAKIRTQALGKLSPEEKAALGLK